MNQNYQTRISPQICKVQTDRKLIAVYDQLKCTALTHYAQLHAKGEYKENDHKVNSLIKVTIQDYSNGTGDKNVIAQFNLAPEQIQFILTRITAGFQEFEWFQSKIYGAPDAQGYSTAQQFSISRHTTDSSGRPMKSPWRIQIVNGKGVKVQNQKGGSYMKSGIFLSGGACCRHVKDSVPLESLDVYRIARFLRNQNKTFDSIDDMMSRYAEPDGASSFQYYLSMEKSHHFTGRKFKTRDWMNQYFTQEDRAFVNEDISAALEIARLLRQIPKIHKHRVLFCFLLYKYTNFDLDQPFQKQYENNNKKLIASLEAMFQKIS